MLLAGLLTLGWFGLSGAQARSHHPHRAALRHERRDRRHDKRQNDRADRHATKRVSHARGGQVRAVGRAVAARPKVQVRPKVVVPTPPGPGPDTPFCNDNCSASVSNTQCEDHCSGVYDIQCQDHCFGAGDVTCHDHCTGAYDINCHDHCYGAQDTNCHDHCYAPGDVNCQSSCYGTGGHKPPPVPPTTEPCQSNCPAAVDNSQCHSHCYGAGDSTCHDWCFGAQDLVCHDHCFGLNDTRCHDHCYGAGAVNCHNNCAPKPPPKPQPHVTTPPSPGGGPPTGALPSGRPTIVKATVPSDAISRAIARPPVTIGQPGGPAGVGLPGQGSGAGPSTRPGTSGRSPLSTPLAPGTAATGAHGHSAAPTRAGRTTRPATTHRPPRQSAIPVGVPTFPSVIDRYIGQVPWWVWLILGVAFVSATAAGLAAWRSGRSARARAGEVALVKADAMTDPLTGILNRRGFTSVAERELERAQRYGHPLALAFVDVRGLKAVNDTRGHQAGDQLLKEVAALLKESSRSHDVVGRIGGDELAVMLTEQGADGMAAVMRRVRGQLPAARAALGFDHDWDLTIGMAVYPRDGHSIEALLDAADRRLYLQRGIELR